MRVVSTLERMNRGKVTEGIINGTRSGETKRIFDNGKNRALREQ